MAGLTATGIGSGIDVSSLVSQLVSAERAPQENRLDLREAKAQARLSAFGSLKSSLETFQSNLSKLSDTETYQKRIGIGGDDEVFTTTIDTTAAAGKYSVQVEQLATRHKIASDAYTDGDTSVGTGQLTFTVNGESFSVSIEEGGDSLTAIRDAINSAEDNVGVSASIVTDQDGAHLVFTSDESGSANAITVQATVGVGDTGDLTALNFDPLDIPGSSLTQKVSADDSIIIVDGFTQTSSDLEVSDMIEGVTFSLVDARPGESFDFEVQVDDAAIKKTVQNFVASYNSLMTTLNSLTAYDAETEVAGVLQGDFTARSIASRLRQEIGGIVDGLDPAFDSLAEIGITTGDNSQLKLDSDKFSEVLSSNFDAIAGIFGGDNGFATRLSDSVSGYVESGGILDSRTEGLETQLARIADQRESLDRRMELVEARYAAQFNAMDSLISQLTTTGDFLTQQLSNLPGVAKNSN
jgi:flagellar hook-associated protein 2